MGVHVTASAITVQVRDAAGLSVDAPWVQVAVPQIVHVEQSGGGAGSGDVVGPNGVEAGRPARFADSSGKVIEAAPINSPGGLVVLDGDGTIPDSRIPASIARDSEVTSAISAATADMVIGTDPRLSDARTPLAHTHPATAVSTVPATTGLDPASTDVEKALTELAARPSGGSAPITKPKVPGGRYLNPPINFMWSTPGGAYVWWVPLPVECPQVFDAIGLVVRSAGAGATADFALVGDVGGYPGTVLRSSTGVSLTTATDAAKVGAFSAVSLPVGLVWMAVRIADPDNNCQVTSAANTAQQPWGVPSTHFNGLPPYPAAGAHTSYGGGYKSATVLSSIPTTAPSGMGGLDRNSPLPGLRAAAW